MIANEKSMKYDYVNRFNNISLSFNSCNGMIEDYYWDVSKLIEDKVISKREAQIINKLGEYLHKENVWTGNYDANILNDIYEEFFQGNDPIKIMFTLPNE